MRSFRSPFILLLALATLFIVGGVHPAHAQPNVVSIKVAPGFFEIPYSIKTVTFQFEEAPPQVNDPVEYISQVTTYGGNVQRPNTQEIMLGNQEFGQLFARLRPKKIKRSFDRHFFDPEAPRAKDPQPVFSRHFSIYFGDSTAAIEFVEQAKQFQGIVRALRLDNIKFNANLNADPLAVPPGRLEHMGRTPLAPARIS